MKYINHDLVGFVNSCYSNTTNSWNHHGFDEKVSQFAYHKQYSLEVKLNDTSTITTSTCITETDKT